MTRIQQVVDAMFEQFPVQDLGGGPERLQFDRLREALVTDANWDGTLKRLYQADQCDEFALGLLWLTERLERDTGRTTANPDEEEVFHRALRRSLGLPEVAFGAFSTEANEPVSSTETPEAVAEEPMQAFATGAPEETVSSEAAAEPVVEPPADVPAEAAEPTISIPMEDDDGGTSDPEIYGRLLERFLESVQSGADDRSELLGRLRANNRAVQADTSASEEFQRYAALVDDFLGYIDEHQLLDDIRVMNLVTNLQEPFGQWLSTDEAGRAGILDQCVEMQRDFRTMFE